MTEMSRRRIHVIGALVVAAVLLAGILLVAVPMISASQSAAAQAASAANSDRLVEAALAHLAEPDSGLARLNGDLSSTRRQIPPRDELRDASALASAAAQFSGARLMRIVFGERQVFTPPTGLGLGKDGTQATQKDTTEPAGGSFQLPVTVEVEVSSAAQAATFLDGLRGGPRLVQVVQAEATPTNNGERLTLTVDALVFSAEG